MATHTPQDPFPNGKPNQDLLQNLSFVYQANIYLNGLGLGKHSPSTSLPGPGPSTTASRIEGASSNIPDKKRTKKAKANEPVGAKIALAAVARRANKGYEYAARHSMLKTDPSIKRTFCGKCYTVLIPGVTAQTRIKGGKKISHRVVTTCLTCHNPTSILAPPHQTPQVLSLPSTAQRQSADAASSSSSKPDDAITNPVPLHGPVRAQRRSRMIKSVPFWTRGDHPIIPLDQLGRHGSANAAEGKTGKGNGGKRPEKVKGVQRQGKAGKGKMEIEGDQQSGGDGHGNTNQRTRPGQASDVGRLPAAMKPVKTISPSTAVSTDMDEEEMMNMC